MAGQLMGAFLDSTDMVQLPLMTDPDLQFLGRLIRDRQAEIRTVRSEAVIWQQSNERDR